MKEKKDKSVIDRILMEAFEQSLVVIEEEDDQDSADGSSPNEGN